MKRPLAALIVEDSADDAVLLIRELRSGFDVVYEQVESPAAMRTLLAGGPWDVVISDYSMPHFSGLAALQVLRESGLDLPFILVSGVAGEAACVEAMRSGAHDYLMKGNLARLVPAVERELREAEVRRQRRRDEELLRLRTEALGAAADGVMITDREGTIVWVNEAYTVLTGFSSSELLGQNPRIQKSGFHGEAYYRDLWTTILDGRVWRGEIIDRRKDRTLRAYERTITPIRGRDGNIGNFIVIQQDVTERKIAAEKVRESETRYRRLFESAQDGFLLLDSETGAITDVNPFLARMLGYTREEMVGTRLWELGSFRNFAPSSSAFQTLRDGGEIRREDLALETKSGEAVAVEIVGGPYPAEGWKAIQYNIRDITERKRSEKALRQEYENHKLALEAASLGAWEYRYDTGEISWDEQYRTIFGMSAETPVSYEEFLSRVHPDDRAATAEARKQAIAGARDGLFHREYRVVWPDGSVHWVASHGRMFFEGAGEARRAIRFVGVVMEVTEHRRAEERLRQAQKLESLGTLAGGVAHDFNNLMTVVMGETSYALAERPDCAHSQAALEATIRAAELTRQLLAYAGKGQAVVKVFDLSDLVSQSSQLLLASISKEISLHFDLPADLPRLEADPSQIGQILMNLVINAGESIAPGVEGTIEIATSSLEITPEQAYRHSKIHDVDAGCFVCLEVRDNGAGMDEETVRRIFDPFFSTKFTGRGLGLAAVYGIVRASKGFIEVQTSPGAGATFRVCLPACKTARPAESASSTPAAGPATILVVDDEKPVRRFVCVMLRQQGYEVLEANDSGEALQGIANASARPLVALVDISLPVGDKNDLLLTLEERCPGLKIIVSSGYPVEDVRRAIRSQAVAALLQKPYTVQTLAERIVEALAAGTLRIARTHG